MYDCYFWWGRRGCIHVFSLLLVCLPLLLSAAPFDEQIEFQQPNGARLRLHGWGDEFHAVFETLDGYTVVFDEARKAYCYAQVRADGQLVSTGALADRGNAAALGLVPHVRMSAEARKAQVAQRRQRWETALEVETRWSQLKALRRQLEAEAGTSGSSTTEGPEPSPPSSTTTGIKVGLTLLIDFSDDPATVPQAEIINYCNGDNYTGYGNNGSVKSYYYDNSNGLLTYTNVVTVYIRVPQKKTYYNDTTKDCGAQGNLLIQDALNAMKALPNYSTDILPTFARLTVDSSSRVMACNVFFAGNNSGVWQKGLWPNSYVLVSGAQPLGNGMSVYKYQISNIGSALSIAVFCHENGHMLCGFPDLYDYNYDSSGGAGRFCLMGNGTDFGNNPPQICAYLKRAAGWATTTDLTTNSSLLATLTATAGTNFNHFYRFQKPGVVTEYYLMENRQKLGRDANVPGAGIAIWHVDELGSRDNQSTNYNTTHSNYELSLMQADNLWQLQKNANLGDAQDPYYLGNPASGYVNEFSDVTAPSARWWDGSVSKVDFSMFSANSATMTFLVGPPALNIAATLLLDGNGNGVIDYNETNQYWVVLRNDGVLAATNVTATLSTTTPGVGFVQATATYPNVAPGQLVTNTTPFVFYTTPDFACGTPISLTAVATCTGRSTSNLLSLATGTTVATRADNSAALDIPDKSTVYSTNFMSGFPGSLAKVTVSLYLTHTFDSDLIVSLIGPDGTTNTLVNRQGSGNDNFGAACSPDSSRTTFDDSASTAIGSGSAPFVGSFRPEQSFSVYAGKSDTAVNGPWVLCVSDVAGGDVGTLQCWSLQLRGPASCTDGSLRPPMVTLDNPANRQFFAATDVIPLNATVLDTTEPVTRVEFYDGASLLAAQTNAPYALTLSNAAPGAHFLQVRAVGQSGLTASATATVGVLGAEGPMTWQGGGANNNWSDAFNWSLFRLPVSGEPLVFAGTNRLAPLNDLVLTPGPLSLVGNGFVVGGSGLTLGGGITNLGANTLALNTSLSVPQSFVSSSGLLTVAGNVTNAGQALTLDGPGDCLVSGVISGSGGVVKNGTGTATFAASHTYSGGTTVNAGTLALSALNAVGGTLTVNSGATLRSDFVNSLGTNSSRVTTLNVAGGTLTHTPGNNLSLWGMVVNLTGGTLQASGTGSASLDIGTDSGSSATGIITLASPNPSVLAGNQVRLRQSSTTFTVADGPAAVDLLVSAPIVSVTSSSGISKRGAGVMVLSGTNTYTGTTTVGAGTLLVNGSTDVSAVNVANAAILGGTGCIGGRVTISAGGYLAPGPLGDLGTLRISNTLTLYGIACLDIRKNGSQTTNDSVVGMSTLTYGGTLSVSNLGPALVEGDSFQLFVATNYAGSFAAYSLPALTNGLAWDVSGLRVNGTLRVAAVPSISVPPHNLTVTSGSAAVFSVAAAGTAPLAYQWRKNGTDLSGATSSSYPIAATTLADAAGYYVVVTNVVGATTSTVATLTVTSPVRPVFGNLSWSAKGSFTLSGTGAASQAYCLLSASNLFEPVVWVPLMTNTADTNGCWSFSDLDATNHPQRFYRLKTP